MLKKNPISRADFLVGALFINVVFILLGVGSTWSYNSYSSYLLDIVHSQRSLLVFQRQQTALLFVWVAIPSIVIIVNIEIAFVRLLKKPVPALLAQVQKIAAWIMFLGIALVVFGNQLVNPIWAKTFSEAGYSRCDTVILRANKQFFNDAWVLNPEDCYDPMLKQILHENHSRLGFEKGARYLEQKHAFLQDRNIHQGSQ
ncbi:hypothetical protein [Halopseudomonas salegens]|uniref:Uncharacterized protein n=1 Tax=Halopseudomonas salegens TaxID=1434072 RepID=A0A1H2F8X4_9GAMM|nr:hypothetical protein [Halopseudomonas salegens]SDU03789.1 hypothetical protein SAMN05216210_1379 [Halopseudomonas salegens]